MKTEMSNMANRNITMAIFYHKHIAASKRKYWIGTVCKEDVNCCETIIKNIAGKGAAAYEKAVKYIENL